MLTDVRIRQTKPRERPFKVSDAHGLHILVQPTGSKLWRLAYRFGGKQKTLALGAYSQVGLKAARDQATDAKRLLAEGIDPSEKRRLAKRIGVLNAASTFRAVGEEFYTKRSKEGCTASTLANYRWLLDLAYSALADRPLAEIEAPELLVIIRQLEARERYEAAHRLRGICGQVLRYGVATGRCKRDVAADLRGALISVPTVHYPAITDPAKIGELLKAIDGYQHVVVRSALQLMALLFLRPGELRLGEWTEIDLPGCVWRIPGPRMKMRKEHRVPLAPQAIAIIEGLRPVRDGQYLLPSNKRGRPLTETAMNSALRRLDYSKDEMVPHGFRAMADTALNESRLFHPDVIERQLAHQEKSSVRRTYDRSEHWEERVRMMGWWADYLDTLRRS
jgi:integrase